MKRSIIFLVLFILFLAAYAISAYAEEWQATVSASPLPVYERMTKRSSVVKLLEYGDPVIVEWELEDMEGKWCGIRQVGGSHTLGYVDCKHLKGVNFKSTPSLRSSDGLRPYSDISVILYETSWCGYCKKARRLLRGMGVNLIEYDIERNSASGREMKSKGGRGVPFIDVEGIYIPGYAPGRIKQAVEQRRSQ